MATTSKSKPKRRARKVPSPGRKMTKQEARDYVFKNYREAMDLLAKH